MQYLKIIVVEFIEIVFIFIKEENLKAEFPKKIYENDEIIMQLILNKWKKNNSFINNQKNLIFDILY